jgi:hypothetical protein
MKLPLQVQFTGAKSAPSVSAGRFKRYDLNKVEES